MQPGELQWVFDWLLYLSWWVVWAIEVVFKRMDDLVSNFAERFGLMKEEQQVLEVARGPSDNLKMAKFLLIGKLLTKKSFNNEAFKRTMTAIWQPKARVQIGDLDNQCFVFSFNSKEERAMFCMGGPWTFNQSLLVMAEADEYVNPRLVPLNMQEFWVQIRGLPLVLMTRPMGREIGMALG